jgi:hypothetical protein
MARTSKVRFLPVDHRPWWEPSTKALSGVKPLGKSYPGQRVPLRPRLEWNTARMAARRRRAPDLLAIQPRGKGLNRGSENELHLSCVRG